MPRILSAHVISGRRTAGAAADATITARWSGVLGVADVPSDNEVVSEHGSGAAADPGRRPSALALLLAMRPQQWVKNLFVGAPLIFAMKLLDEAYLGVS